jgi:hypothetical protein
MAGLLWPVAGPAQAADAPHVLPPVVPHATAPHAMTPATVCQFGACYDYVAGNQSVNNQGADVTSLVADPQPNHNFPAEHSLQELAVQNTNQTSTVEVGWIVDKNLNGDYLPHLFVFHWIGGQGTCYNGCGYVQTSSTVHAGDALTTGSFVTFGLHLVAGDWQVLVNGTEIGYFPGSEWNGTYTQGQLVSTFGEVALDPDDVPSCAQMGNGQFGMNVNSSWLADYRLQSGSAAPSLNVFSTNSADYDHGFVFASGFHLGGPGSGTTCTA